MMESVLAADRPLALPRWLQARIEAESVKACQEKYQGSDDPIFKDRAVAIKEERADLVKHHLWVLWTDYFKPEHLEVNPDLHEKFWNATKLAGASKKSEDPAQGRIDAAGRAASACVNPVSDQRGSAEYKRHVAGVLTALLRTVLVPLFTDSNAVTRLAELAAIRLQVESGEYLRYVPPIA